MSDKQSGIREGDPIYIESLLSYAEWRARMKKYPNTSHLDKPRVIYDFKVMGNDGQPNMKWRYQMGNNLAPGEIHTINLAIIKLQKEKGMFPEERKSFPKSDQQLKEEGLERAKEIKYPQHDSVRSGDGHWPGLPFTP